MRLPVLLFYALLPFLAIAQIPSETQNISFPSEKFTLHCTPQDSLVAVNLLKDFASSIDSVELFFDHRFPKKFEVFIFPNRAALDRQWQKDWGDTTFQSACWMVASGVAHRLDVLSPNAWSQEACEHKAGDSLATSRLIRHELVHVFHGQHNPKPDFTGMDEMAWWVEGIAVYASGQLSPARCKGVQELLQNDKAPNSLQQFWTGKHKYGLAGTMALLLDVTKGRSVLFKLLALTGTNQALEMLETDEPTLLDAWRNYWLRNQ